MAGSTTVQIRVPDDLLAQIDAASSDTNRTAWLLGLAERELADAGPDLAEFGGTAGTSSPLASLPPTSTIPAAGVPSPGVACMWPECWDRSTARYGVLSEAELDRGGYRDQQRSAELAGIALCGPHASRLNGFRFVRSSAATRTSSTRQTEPATA